MKTRKKKTRTIKKYAVGSGATGTIKNYMPNPNEVFRQNEINWDKAKAEAHSNPWIRGLDMLGGLTTQVGMSIAGKGGGESENIDADASLGVPPITSPTQQVDTEFGFDKGKYDWGQSAPQYAGIGTDKKGMETAEGEFEGGELLEYPDGQIEEMSGASHSQGGIVKEVPAGTKVHSDFDESSMPGASPEFVKSIEDYLSVNGKTPAEAKKARMNKIGKVEKKLEKDSSDVVNKETHKRLSQQDALADEINFEKQGKVRQMTEAYKYAFGTDEDGVMSFSAGTSKWGMAWDTAKKGATEYAKGFTGGDLLGLAGTLSSGFAGRKNAMDNAATDTPNENLYKGFADDAIGSIDQAGSILDTQQALAKKQVQLNQNKQLTKGRNSARGVNTMRALDAGAFTQSNQALESIYSNFSGMMMDNLYKKSQAEMSKGQIEAQGATAADLANRQDKDINDSNLAAANQNMATAVQMTGKDLNANKTNRILTTLTGQLSKHGLKFDGKGNIIQG